MRRSFPLIGVAVACLLLSAISPTVYAFSTGQAASVVLGQTGFTSKTAATTQTGMNAPFDVAISPSGNTWVVDFSNNRVLEFPSPASNGEAAAIVLGQTGFMSKTAATTQTGLNAPRSVAIGPGGSIWVADTSNCRILKFLAPLTIGEKASLVLGQKDFTHNGCAVSSTALNFPNGVAVDSSGNVWVADTGNCRVLEFTNPTSNGTAASVVLGQPDFSHSGCVTTRTGLNVPTGVTVGPAGNVLVADQFNSRVVKFDAPFTSGEKASLVLGQPDYTHNSCATTKTGMCFPADVAADSSGHIWVADGGNNRVLEFPNTSSNGQAASLVLGQTGFTGGSAATTKTGMNGPFGITVGPAGNVWVADTNNNRVIQFRTTTTTKVTCSPSSVGVGSPTTCTSTVTDTTGGTATPAGTVKFSSSLPGTFGSTKCTLAGSGTSASCSVKFTPSSIGSYVINANFAGDGDHLGSKGKFTLSVV